MMVTYKYAKWYTVMIERGHTPIMDEDLGGMNIFVVDADFHNGPGCSTCGWSCCMHCYSVDDIPECKGSRK